MDQKKKMMTFVQIKQKAVQEWFGAVVSVVWTNGVELSLFAIKSSFQQDSC